MISALPLTSCSSLGGAKQCQQLANRYWAEYQAYVDARAANGGVESDAVMAHYYQSGKYYLKFMEIGCENKGFSIDQNSSGSNSGQGGTTQTSGVSQNYVCQELGNIFDQYQNSLDQWRDTNSGVAFEEIFQFSNYAAEQARNLADQIASSGIDWDSAGIVSGLISDFADNIDEISSAVDRNFFRPGRDLLTIQRDMTNSVNSVLNSACK